MDRWEIGDLGSLATDQSCPGLKPGLGISEIWRHQVCLNTYGDSNDVFVTKHRFMRDDKKITGTNPRASFMMPDAVLERPLWITMSG